MKAQVWASKGEIVLTLTPAEFEIISEGVEVLAEALGKEALRDQEVEHVAVLMAELGEVTTQAEELGMLPS